MTASFRRLRPTLGALALLCIIPLGGAGCASCEKAGFSGLSVMGGTINDPSNKSLRRGLLQFGLDQACAEMLKRPTALREGGETAGSATNPTNGRFFPKSCSQAQADNGDLVISFSGSGYTYASGVHKVTFEAAATVRYDQDFLMSGDTLYGYFRTKEVSKPDIKLKVIESTLPAIANQLTGFGENYAKQLLSERLRDGFTVKRKSNSETDFRAGIVQLGTWPKLGYAVDGGLTLANDRTEVHEQQRDFIGPFENDDDDQVMTVTGKIDGAPGVNILVVDGATGDTWIDKYLTIGDATPPPSPPRQMIVAKQGAEFRLQIAGKGRYWLVFDNTSTISGGISPPGNFLDDRAAVVSFAVGLGAK
ncbi:MAG: hypothetical protein ABI175_27535 [Polyangiales bacterium]